MRRNATEGPMNAHELAAAMGRSYPTAKRMLASWAAMQSLPSIPRVERRKGRTGRPAYRVDEASFRRWALSDGYGEAA